VFEALNVEWDSSFRKESQYRDGFLLYNGVTTGFDPFLCRERQPIGDVSELAGLTGTERKRGPGPNSAQSQSWI